MNSSQRYARLHEILSGARALHGESLDAFLADACGDDTGLRDAAEALLVAGHDASDGVFSDSKIAGVRGRLENVLADASLTERLPETIGEYRILRQIGRGGMGIVYEAEQQSPRRNVALKVLQPGMVRDSLLRRFAQEAQVLGLLQHPNIASVYDAGTCDLGFGELPFFAMELIHGTPLTSFARERGLDIRARVSLVTKLCDAVQHAHERGVIHRDLKPANILVVADTGSDGPQPKILDFGIARSTDGDQHTLQTQTGQLLGTLGYMSPEQIEGDPDSIDPRSDVYALGVILYELLAGRLPLDVEGSSIAKAGHIIQNVQPAPLGRMRPECHGDLETVCAKALAKEKEFRYGSASELAKDLRRFLHSQPVLARPQTTWYHLTTFARRNKALVGGAVATLLVSVVGAVVATSLAVEATRRADEVFRLSALQDHQELLTRVDELWPPHPDQLPAYRRWLTDARTLVADLPLHRAKRSELRALALPQSDAEREADRRAHPDFARLEALPTLIASQRAALSQRRGGVGTEPLEAAELAKAKEEIAALEAEVEELESRVSERRTWRFPDTSEGREARWWHTNLTSLIESLVSLQEPTGLLSEEDDAVSAEHGWSVPRRIRFAERLRDGLATGGPWHDRWAEAAAAIAAHPGYAGLELSPQTGLVPIGPDPESGLWEFWHVATGAEPARDAEGRLVLTEEMGVVLVLIPAGASWMGASADADAEHNRDPHAASDEGPVHEVTLSAYFLSKYEMTQAQWQRATGTDPSFRTPLTRDYIRSRLHPVEQVSWSACRRELERMGLRLPTEAQWEHGCRAGSAGPRPFPDADFALHANVKDKAFAESFSGVNTVETWDDGFAAHGPVGALRPNAFGLHDVLGNVWEWCLDTHYEDFYARSGNVDPFADGGSADPRVSRGGSFNDLAANTRSAIRHNFAPSFASYSRGVRPARIISR